MVRHAFTPPILLLCLGCTADLGNGESRASDSENAIPGQEPIDPADPDSPDVPIMTGTGGQLGIGRDDVESACDERGGTLGVGVTKLRRLSALEFNHTVQSLLGGAPFDYTSDLPADEPMGPFVSNQSLVVGTQEARQYQGVAGLIADRALEGGTQFLPCAAPTGSETTCVQEFIRAVAPRAFRRPLETGEAESLLAMYVLGRDGPTGSSQDVTRGLHLLLRAIFGSPDLLYIVDTGESGVPTSTPERASAYTLASRLSLAFWNAPPDAELVSLAETGQLLDDAIYATQVERILTDPRAQEAVAHFFAELTGVTHLPEKEKDPTLFPQFNAQLVQEMQSEQANFVKDVVFRQDGLWSTLLGTNYTAPGPALADLYGVSPTPPVILPPEQRRGLFTQAAYLASHNKKDQTSPVHLGINIREAILCETMQPPPPNIDTTLPEVTGEVRTSRDRFRLHEVGPCQTCHELIDPIGLAFEHFDAIGAYRETDGGAPIDPTGQIIARGDAEDGPFFTGALELSDQLAASEQVRDCIARQFLRSALDRQESQLDACTTLSVVEGFAASSGNIRELLSELAQTEAFKNIILNPPEDVQQ